MVSYSNLQERGWLPPDEATRLQAIIAMQRDAMGAAFEKLNLAGSGHPYHGHAMTILDKALTASPSDFIEKIRKEEREAIKKCIQCLDQMEKDKILEDEGAYSEAIHDALEIIRARSQEQK